MHFFLIIKMILLNSCRDAEALSVICLAVLTWENPPEPQHQLAARGVTGMMDTLGTTTYFLQPWTMQPET